VSRASDRRRLAHAAAPVLFLAVVTAAVLLVRSGLHAGQSGTTSTPRVTTPAATTTVAHTKRRRPSGARFYTVQTGDTFGSISSKTGVPVSELERLNPGISSNALQIGQKLRVK
jgi:LysM repeat protein